MRVDVRDFAALRLPLAVATGLLVAAAGVAGYGLNSARRAESDYRAALARHARAEAELQQIVGDREEIGKRIALFVRLQEEGVIGPERRLDWIETLRTLQRRMRLPELKYELAAARPLAGNVGDHVFSASRLRLHLRLAHEMEMLAFLDSLRNQAKALVLIRRCRLARLPAPDPLSSLGADCDLDFITFAQQERPR